MSNPTDTTLREQAILNRSFNPDTNKIVVEADVTSSDKFDGGEQTIGTSASEITFSAQTKTLVIQADHSNTGSIWVGKSNITNSANRMVRLMAGESLSRSFNDASVALYAVSDAATQKIYKIATTS